MKDYSLPGDPYGVAEYTAQSAEPLSDHRKSSQPSGVDVRGCTLAAPRGIPTQAEVDAILGRSKS